MADFYIAKNTVFIYACDIDISKHYITHKNIAVIQLVSDITSALS